MALVAMDYNMVDPEGTFSSFKRILLGSVTLVHLLSIRLENGVTGTVTSLDLWKEVNFRPHEIDGEEGHGLLISLLYLDKYWLSKCWEIELYWEWYFRFNYIEFSTAEMLIKKKKQNRKIPGTCLETSLSFVCVLFFFFLIDNKSNVWALRSIWKA